MAHNLNTIHRRKLRYQSKAVPELCDIIKTSILTEKSVFMEEEYNTVVLIVEDKYNKLMIKNAMESIFTGVSVINVRTLNYKATNHRYKNKYKFQKSGYKKAYIKLTPDSIIELGENQTAITKFTKHKTHNPEEQK